MKVQNIVLIKFHKDIELKYCVGRGAWIVRDNTIGKIVLISYSDAECPEHIQGIGFENIQILTIQRFQDFETIEI